jgi:hypothetical protein
MAGCNLSLLRRFGLFHAGGRFALSGIEGGLGFVVVLDYCGLSGGGLGDGRNAPRGITAQGILGGEIEGFEVGDVAAAWAAGQPRAAVPT